MAGDIVAELGHLFLGTRLKRLAERMQADVLKVAVEAGLPIQIGRASCRERVLPTV